MKKYFKIIISKEGSVFSVYSDEMGMTGLGSATIHRATEVKFSNEADKKCWEIISLSPYFPKEEILATGFLLRSDAITWEVEYLNKHLSEIINEYQRCNFNRKKESCGGAGG